MSSSSQKTASPFVSRSNSMSDEDNADLNKSTNIKSARKSGSNSASRMNRQKAKTQMISNKSNNKDLQTAPSIGSTQEQNPDENPPPQNEEEKSKTAKKQPKLTLKRQMTQKRQSQVIGISSTKPAPRKSMSIQIDSPLTNLAQQASGRNSLTQIKNNANNSAGRQSVMVTQIKTGSDNGNNKHKSLGGALTIEELSEKDSDEESSRYNKNETIQEDDDEEDNPFKDYENDELFKKVCAIADKITQQNPSEADQMEIVNYLKQLPQFEGRFDHLNKNLTKKLIDCFEIRFMERGEYLFRKNDKPDYAYVILYGSVICLNVKSSTYIIGQEPQSPMIEVQKKESVNVSTLNPEALKKYQEEQKEKELLANRRRKIYKDNFVTVEEEFKVVELGVGIMIGEVAMMDKNGVRALSGMAKNDSIFLLLNREAFDVLVKEREKKENEVLTQFIFDSVPKIRDLFQFKKVVKTVKINFKHEKHLRGKEIIKEGQKSDRLYIIKEGMCAMYKTIELKDMLGMPKIKQEKIMNIETCGIFGEESLIFDSESTYTIKSITPVTMVYITYNDLKREFKRLLPSLGEFCQKRLNFILERYQKIKNARNYERKHFNSKIEKGSMNVFLQRDFKNQIDFADNRTKRKLQVFFLRKELQQLQDAKQRLNEEMEREKQELTNIHTNLTNQNTSRFVPQMIETPQLQYVNKVLFPQRIKQQQDQGQGGSMRSIKQTMNIDFNKRQSIILAPKMLNSQSTQSLITPTKQIVSLLFSQILSILQLAQSMQNPIQPNSPQVQIIQNHQYQQYSLKNKRTLSQIHGGPNNNQFFMTNDNRYNNSSQSNLNINQNGKKNNDHNAGIDHLIKITSLDTDEDGPSARFTGMSAQNKPPVRMRAASTLSGPMKSNQGTTITPSTSISIKGSNIQSEASKNHFFDKRNINVKN
ncbi:camp-dependent protein kinase regulatory [Stylonychia lemnae]|uniref:Camp-dependent protein kinase regulatory n=1 Tax=Stylonychia lemnae TaxID=5949 RepID=A0A078BC90_STYLE|nr:camp-dependent protein kinase regulatory [Stylonychia lemnae]|eukprot:CDW91816.1 camp-dependent protein kinase regulatory [Stylonychia lemnae]